MSNTHSVDELDEILFELVDTVQDATTQIVDGKIRDTQYAMKRTVAHIEARTKLKALLLKEVLELLPEKIDMKHAIKTHSDAGAGYTIGFNQCIDTIKQNAERKYK